MTDAMYDGHESTMIVTENQLIEAAWVLINAKIMTKDDFNWCNL